MAGGAPAPGPSTSNSGNPAVSSGNSAGNATTVPNAIAPGVTSAGRWATGSGWWVAIACIAAIGTAQIPGVAPISGGILLIALIYQTNLMLTGK